MTVTVLIPAKNESARIADTVRAALLIDRVQRVLVVDDGSNDDTASLARAAGAETLRLPSDVGKGAALEAGCERLGAADVMLILDGDLGRSAAQGAALLAPVLAGDADMSVARFPAAQNPAGFGLVKGLARWGIAHLGRGFDCEAPLSGQRAMTRDALAAARPFGGGFGTEVTTTVRVLRAGLRVIEVPTSMTHAATGRDIAGFVHRGRQFVDVARALLRLALARPRART